MVHAHKPIWNLGDRRHPGLLVLTQFRCGCFTAAYPVLNAETTPAGNAYDFRNTIDDDPFYLLKFNCR